MRRTRHVADRGPVAFVVVLMALAGCGESTPTNSVGRKPSIELNQHLPHVGQRCSPTRPPPSTFSCVRRASGYALQTVFTVRCPSYSARTPQAPVRFSAIQGYGTTCAEVTRLLAAFAHNNLRDLGTFLDGFDCGIPPPAPKGVSSRLPANFGSCDKSASIGFEFTFARAH
jgi:hypothetical protein